VTNGPGRQKQSYRTGDVWKRCRATAVTERQPTSWTMVRSTKSTIHRVSGALSMEVNRPGRDAIHSAPSSADIQNGWGYIYVLSHISSRLQHQALHKRAPSVKFISVRPSICM